MNYLHDKLMTIAEAYYTCIIILSTVATLIGCDIKPVIHD